MEILNRLKIDHSSKVKVRHLLEEEFSCPSQENSLPLVITPKGQANYKSLLQFVESQGTLLKELVTQYGGLLFRGFNIPNVSAFTGLLEKMGFKLENRYTGGFAPRHKVEGQAFTSVDIKNKFPIFAHNEMTYQNLMPKMVAFFCQNAAKTYGETPIFNGAKIFRSLPSDVINLLSERKIKYIRKYRKNLPIVPYSLSRGWTLMFETEDKKEIERLCEINGARCHWGHNDSLEIETITEPFIIHPGTKEKCFSLQLLNQHGVTQDLKNLLGRINPILIYFAIAMVNLAFKLEMVPMRVSFGNGERLNKEISQEIWKAIWKHAVIFPWRQNDILVLDNFKTAHARLNVLPPRKILFAMGDMMNLPRTVSLIQKRDIITA